MLGKIARKVYHVLVRRPAPQKEADAQSMYAELTKRTAPNNFGAREEYPDLPRPFAPHPTSVQMHGTTMLTQLYTGQKMYVDSRDVSIAPHIIVDGLWEAHVTRAIATLLQEDDTFFDIGANFGYYSCIAATRTNRHHDTINIHAFEPNPEIAALLHKTFSINGLTDTARIVEAGVAEKPGDLTLHLGGDMWGGSSFRKELTHNKKAETVTVPVTTVDAYCKEYKIAQVDVVKLDVEGYEDHAYAGMHHTIKANPQMRLVMEFTFGAYENEPDFFAQLQSDFKYMYYIDPRGEFEFITNFEALRSKTHDDLVMLVLTNKELV